MRHYKWKANLVLTKGKTMNRLILFLLSISISTAILAEEKVLLPQFEKDFNNTLHKALNAKKDFRSHAKIIRRGLLGNQMTYRALSAQWFIKHGTIEDVPYLINSLSDESSHKGANYPLAAMATTRYWANVALISICKTSYDYQWNASKEKRKYSIDLWQQHWERVKPKN